MRELDQPRSQVLIHAAIVEVSGDIAKTLGVQWGVNAGRGRGGITFPGTGIQIGALSQSNIKLPEGAVLQVGNDRFNVLVSALASDTNNNVLSTPSLLTWTIRKPRSWWAKTCRSKLAPIQALVKTPKTPLPR